MKKTPGRFAQVLVVMAIVAHALLAGLRAGAQPDAIDKAGLGTRLGSILVEMPGATKESISPSFAYVSTQLEEKTFYVNFTATSAMTKLAIYYNDGCSVAVNGVTVMNKFRQPAVGFEELPPTLKPGTGYQITVKYSNVIYSSGEQTTASRCTLTATPPSQLLLQNPPQEPPAPRFQRRLPRLRSRPQPHARPPLLHPHQLPGQRLHQLPFPRKSGCASSAIRMGRLAPNGRTTLLPAAMSGALWKFMSAHGKSSPAT